MNRSDEILRALGRIEGELYGLRRRDRVERMLEFIDLVKRLWTEDNVTFEGKHYHCEGITIDPKPAGHLDSAELASLHERLVRHYGLDMRQLVRSELERLADAQRQRST